MDATSLAEAEVTEVRLIQRTAYALRLDVARLVGLAGSRGDEQADLIAEIVRLADEISEAYVEATRSTLSVKRYRTAVASWEAMQALAAELERRLETSDMGTGLAAQSHTP
jgi:hypothetical protein